ncbi:MAG: GT4 family glycosyltransferase PelF [Thiobacillus sp.]
MSRPPRYLRQAQRADIGLVLEGTFPYVAGGVSSWVNQIIRSFPQYSFAGIFLGSRPQDYGDPKYPLPDNLVHLEVHFLHEQAATPPVMKQTLAADMMQRVREAHDTLRATPGEAGGCSAMRDLLAAIKPGGGLPYEGFLYSEQSWNFVTDAYRKFCRDPSFVDYFWTWRIMHAPLWRLSRIASEFIPVDAIHTISTGYAGLMAAMLKGYQGRPMLLSEHGIYTKERKIDLFQAEWIRDNRNVFDKDPSEVAYFKDMWVRFFEALGKICYDAADDIVALYETNRLRQVADGADPARTRNIPNGVNIARLAPLREKRSPVPPRTFCLLGRVVPIKDVKTFIRAMRTIADHDPEAEGWIAGPTDEDPAYYQECLNLVESLGLSERVKFLGFQKIDELLPRVGALILSSISEALPLVILEGYAAGVPSIATDVGACRQLIEGLTPEDRALGPSGRVVGIADPGALARAALDLMQPQNWQAAQAAGIARVERFYSLEMMIDAYRELYVKSAGERD